MHVFKNLITARQKLGGEGDNPNRRTVWYKHSKIEEKNLKKNREKKIKNKNFLYKLILSASFYVRRINYHKIYLTRF